MNIHDRIIVLETRYMEARKRRIRAERTHKMLNRTYERLEKERAALLLFSEQLLETFRVEVEKLLTAAVRAVFDDREYEFKVNFNRRADRIETETFILSGSLELVPKDDMGGGVKPVIGFPLRLIMLGTKRKLIWLDEPMKGSLGREDELLPRTMLMFKEIAEKLGVQLIVNTHETDFIDMADRAYRFIHTGRRTKAKLIKE